MNALHCQKCTARYDKSERIPLVLACGHSACMVCLINQVYRAVPVFTCKCSGIQHMTVQIVSQMITNKDLLQLVCFENQGIKEIQTVKMPLKQGSFQTPKPERPYWFTPGASARNLFTQPRVSAFQENFQSMNSPYRLSSSTSVALKCKRANCQNDRYYQDGEIFEYCGVECYNQDSLQKQSSLDQNFDIQ